MKTTTKIVLGIALLAVGSAGCFFWNTALYEFAQLAQSETVPSEYELASEWPALSRALRIWRIDIHGQLRDTGFDAGNFVYEVVHGFLIGRYISFLIGASGVWIALFHHPQGKGAGLTLKILRWSVVALTVFVSCVFLWTYIQ